MEGIEAVIGLEIHAQLLTQTKMFCGCSTRFGAEPNTQVCPVCLGLPGALPVLNKKAVELALMVGLSANCSINKRSVFARKNYFYPDLPKNYQISQFGEPLCSGGWVDVDTGDGRARIGLTRIHLEEDAGKSIHLDEGGRRWTLLDFNRCGVPLIEIVTLPQIAEASEARQFLTTLKQLLEYLGASSGNMEEGSLRCDVNVSVRRKGDYRLGPKVEIKNLNSFRNVERATQFEIERQGHLLESGEPLAEETLLWDAAREEAVAMRAKEETHDYRYFPEPDLLYLDVREGWVDGVRSGLPELPGTREKRFQEQHGLPQYDAAVLCGSKELSEYFEEVVRLSGDPKTASNWIMTEVLREVKARGGHLGDSPVSAAGLASLLRLVEKGTLSGKMAKEVFSQMSSTGASAEDIVRERKLLQITDSAEIGRVTTQVILENPGPVSDYMRGRQTTFGFLMGQVMKKTGGKANPALANRILRQQLESAREQGRK